MYYFVLFLKVSLYFWESSGGWDNGGNCIDVAWMMKEGNSYMGGGSGEDRKELCWDPLG